MRRVPGAGPLRRLTVLAAVIGALALVTSLGGGLVLAAQEGSEAESALIDDLVAIETDLAAVAPLPAVETFPDRTWGVLSGDFVGSSLALEEADGDLGLLVERAAAIDTPVGDAVETVASSYRTMVLGYGYLAAYERAGLVVPASQPDDEGEDDEGVDPEPAQAGDEARGQAEVGLDLLLEALAGHHDGYTVLRDRDLGDDRVVFEQRYEEVVTAARTEALDARRALSLSSTHILVGVQRFEPGNTGVAPANYVRYLCADRDDWYTTRTEGQVPEIAVPQGDVPDLPIPDCPALTNGNQVRAVPPEPAG